MSSLKGKEEKYISWLLEGPVKPYSVFLLYLFLFLFYKHVLNTNWEWSTLSYYGRNSKVNHLPLYPTQICYRRYLLQEICGAVLGFIVIYLNIRHIQLLRVRHEIELEFFLGKCIRKKERQWSGYNYGSVMLKLFSIKKLLYL